MSTNYQYGPALTVANTILEQLGGPRFQIMTGAKHFLGDANSLKFSLPKAYNGINKVIITLTPMDLYKVEFWYTKGIDWRKVAESELVYADKLREVFTAATGLETSL